MCDQPQVPILPGAARTSPFAWQLDEPAQWFAGVYFGRDAGFPARAVHIDVGLKE